MKKILELRETNCVKMNFSKRKIWMQVIFFYLHGMVMQKRRCYIDWFFKNNNKKVYLNKYSSVWNIRWGNQPILYTSRPQTCINKKLDLFLPIIAALYAHIVQIIVLVLNFNVIVPKRTSLHKKSLKSRFIGNVKQCVGGNSNSRHFHHTAIRIDIYMSSTQNLLFHRTIGNYLVGCVCFF